MYNVSINTQNGKWNCSCPSWRNSCKHIVASALYLVYKSPEIFGSTSSTPSSDWEKILQLQREKDKLFKEVLTFDKTVSSLTSDDIRKIFE